MSIFAQAAFFENSLDDAAFCLVVSVKGSTPRKVGAKMIVIDRGDDLGEIKGSIGGGAIEHLVRKKAIVAIRAQKAELLTTSLRNELGMCCGGEMTVFIEPIAKQPKFFCFGAGHIAQALCPMMKDLGFKVFVIDERPKMLESKVFSTCHKIDDCSGFAIKDMPLKNAFVVIATHDHALDQSIAENILAHEFSYAALVGSKRKALMTKKRLLAKGLKDFQRIICPAGLDISAISPEEIALSIAAQIIQHKNSQSLQNNVKSDFYRNTSKVGSDVDLHSSYGFN